MYFLKNKLTAEQMFKNHKTHFHSLQLLFPYWKICISFLIHAQYEMLRIRNNAGGTFCAFVLFFSISRDDDYDDELLVDKAKFSETGVRRLNPQ